MSVTLSVCMATFNGSRFIREQLESVLSQLGPDDELIVSDDASTDDTLDIVRSYHDSRILILGTDNEFRSPVRNFEHALYHASKTIVVLADQDDIWLPGRVTLIHERLDAKAEQAALIMMDGEIVDVVCNRLGESIFAANRVGPGILKNIYDNTYTGCCLAFTRPLLSIVMPFPHRIPMHDMWIGILCEVFGEVDFVPVKTIRYRRHPANTSFVRPRMSVQIMRRLVLSLCLINRIIRVMAGVQLRERNLFK